jgi:choline dehydrogenase
VESFDYIVVGGGTAGSVLAARLSQDPETRVLLLEAGAADPIPAVSDPTAWPTLAGTSVDWAYETVPQTATDGAVHQWPRGKVLGGSSAINAMSHVRGDRGSYDSWEAAGADGWGYDALLPFFKRSEQVAGRDPAYRGVDGPMIVRPAASTDPLLRRCFDAAVEAGYPAAEDTNASSAEGTAWLELNVVNGRRQSAADAYLAPAAGRANLTIVTDAQARRLLIEHASCRGVEFSRGGRLQTALAAGEVVLSAGAIGTPQLLMLSGVGPAGHLRELGIEVVADLPGVGANLQDHPMSQVAYTATHPVGPGGYTTRPHVLLRSDLSAAPDLQVLFVEFPVHPRKAPGPEDGYSILFSLMTPASRGTVRLASADPAEPPLIDPRYLTDPSDIARMTTGLRVAREIGSARALAAVRGRELFPGPDAQTDEALHAYLRATLSTYFHPVGTAKIGTDAMAVVDPLLQVQGIANLRIADASVMPSIVSANTNATVLAIAERAASLIGGESTIRAAATRLALSGNRAPRGPWRKRWRSRSGSTSPGSQRLSG